MAGIFLIGLLLAAWLGWAVLAGLAFVAGCVLAARYAATAALLTVVVSPPLLFLAAVILVSAVTVPGGLFMSVVVGSVVTLASVAPWLAVGMVLTVSSPGSAACRGASGRTCAGNCVPAARWTQRLS